MGGEDHSFEDRMLQEYRETAYANRQLAQWALAHFGDRTDFEAYTRTIISLGNSGSDFVIDKVHNDLASQGFNYIPDAIWRMHERYRTEAKKNAAKSLAA